MTSENPDFAPETILREMRTGMGQAIDHTLKELNVLHTGKASPAMVQHVTIDLGVNGKLPLQQMAMITTPDPHTIRVEPWDKQQGTLEKIAKALRVANLGINPVVQGNIVRCPLPEPSRERRLNLCKKAQEVTESIGHKGVRLARQKAMDAAKLAPSEEVRDRLKEQIEKINKDFTQRLKDNLEQKKKELLPEGSPVIGAQPPKKKKKKKGKRG